MKKGLLFFILFFAFTSIASAQSFKKYPIGKSGCSAYFYCNPGDVDETYSPDSSVVYTTECTDKSVTYAVICVKLKEKLVKTEDREAIIIQYLDYLKSTFEVTSAAGYGKGHEIKGRADIKGVIDYWKDAQENNIKVTGWANDSYLAIMIVVSPDVLDFTRTENFSKGLVMPDAKK